MPELFIIALASAVTVCAIAVVAYTRMRRRPTEREWAAVDHHFKPCTVGEAHVQITTPEDQ